MIGPGFYFQFARLAIRLLLVIHRDLVKLRNAHEPREVVEADAEAWLERYR